MHKLVAILAFLGLLSTTVTAAKFVDIPTFHWAGNAVDKMVALNVTGGYPDGTFRGLKTVTRYELAQYLANYDAHIMKTLQTVPKVSGSALAVSEKEALEKKIADLEYNVAKLAEICASLNAKLKK